MTIKEVIEQLSTYENQDATVHVVYSNAENDIFNSADLELLPDTSGDGYVDIFVLEAA